MNEDVSPAGAGDRDNESSSADDETEEEPVVESLVEGRAKRATAGNRLNALLNKEQDDDLELLFAEDEEEEDIEFEDEDENASDAHLDSSSDEEDQGPTKGDDDFAGEKELQKQDRAERQKKRKAQGLFKRPGVPRKKVKIDPSATPTVPTTPAPKQRKKSERVSWVHTEADAPVRVSSRKHTVKNREVIHQRLVQSEQSRLKIMQHMEEAAKRKQAAKPKALAQADRLEEAAKTEKKNAKSLNRWEEAEKKRSEGQRARLEALHNRQLTGPVIRWWSGLARWVNGKIGQLGVKEIREAGFVEKPTVREDKKMNLHGEYRAQNSGFVDHYRSSEMPGIVHPHALTESSEPLHLQNVYHNPSQQQITFAPPQGPYGFLDGIHAYAALPMQHHQAEFTGTADGDATPQNYSQMLYAKPPERRPTLLAPSRPVIPEVNFTSRTLVALRNVDANALKIPEVQNSVLLKKKSGKLQSKSITSEA